MHSMSILPVKCEPLTFATLIQSRIQLSKRLPLLIALPLPNLCVVNV